MSQRARYVLWAMPVLANSTSLKGDFHNGSTNKVHNHLNWLALTVLGCPYRLRKLLSRARDCGHQRRCFLKSNLINGYYWLVDVGLGPEPKAYPDRHNWRTKSVIPTEHAEINQGSPICVE
jgi:hypothetical protein